MALPAAVYFYDAFVQALAFNVKFIISLPRPPTIRQIVGLGQIFYCIHISPRRKVIFSFCRLLKLRVGSGSFFFNEHSFGKDIFSSRNFKPQPVSAGVARKKMHFI